MLFGRIPEISFINRFNWSHVHQSKYKKRTHTLFRWVAGNRESIITYMEAETIQPDKQAVSLCLVLQQGGKNNGMCVCVCVFLAHKLIISLASVRPFSMQFLACKTPAKNLSIENSSGRQPRAKLSFQWKWYIWQVENPKTLCFNYSPTLSISTWKPK